MPHRDIICFDGNKIPANTAKKRLSRFFELVSVFVHAAGDADAVLMKENVQLDAVGAHKALGEFVNHAGLGIGAALDKESAAALLAAQHLRLLAAHDYSLIGVNGVGGNDAHFVEQAVEAVGLQKLICEFGVDILWIEAGLKDKGLSVHMADTHKAVNLGVGAAEFQHFHDIGSGLDHLKLHQGGGGSHAHGADFAGKGVDHLGLAADLRLSHEGAAALLADN